MQDPISSIYSDGNYERNNPGWHAGDSPWKATHIARLLDAHGVQPRRLCEVGCGAGEILVNLARRYGCPTTFTGYEVSPQAYAICCAKASARLHFVNGSPFVSPLPDQEPFDVAMAIDVFEHVEDYIGFLRQFHPLGRYKVFHIPLDLSVQTVFRASPLRRVRETVGHLHYFTKETALASLAHTGYTVIDHRYTAHAVELPNRGWKATLGILPRRLSFALSEDLAVRILGGYSLLVLAT